MAGSKALMMAVLVIGIAFHSSLVDATIAKSMYLNWGAHHSTILGNGDDLRLVLDQSSGICILCLFKIGMSCFLFRL